MADPKTATKSVLFVCTFNSIRSPMAEAILRDMSERKGLGLQVCSAGVQAKLTDGYAIASMREIGLDMSKHEGQTLEDVDLSQVELIVSLSDPARMFLMHFTAGRNIAHEHWPTQEPQLGQEASREEQRAHLNRVRDGLVRKIKERFVTGAAITH